MILVIDESRRYANSITDMLFYMGFLAYGTTPSDGLNEISPLYRAILISNPENLPDVEDYISRLKKYCSSIPIFSISDGQNPYQHLFDISFNNAIYSTTLVCKIIDWCIKNNRAEIGVYKLAGLNASAGLQSVTYFEKPLLMTKTELKIIRYLIRTYPNPQSIENILKYLYPASKRPERSSIRTHISIINKRFHALAQRNLIANVGKEGYLIMTPIARDKYFPSNA